MKKLSIVTMTYNCVGEIAGYMEGFSRLDRDQFDWIVLDAGSKDGTAAALEQHRAKFTHFVSEPDGGFYHGMNKALLQIKTPYYMVFGADDRPAPDLLEKVLPLLDGDAALVLGGVRLMPINRIKQAGPRWMHHLVWGRAVSHHSVGMAISMAAHARFGKYDTGYTLVADGLFLKRVLRSSSVIVRTSAIFGDFRLGGMSSQQDLRSIAETFLLQVSEGSNVLLQLGFFCFRILKRSATLSVKAMLGSPA
jgi:glycosyltransferase involved in cell wall biosynthesis